MPMPLMRGHPAELKLMTGALTIQMRGGNVNLYPGQVFVVPRGVQHCPIADGEVHALHGRASQERTTDNACPTGIGRSQARG